MEQGERFDRPYRYKDNSHRVRGAGTIFFLGGGGGKNVDMPSDCQNLGGGEQAYPFHWDKMLGIAPLAPPPPRLPRPCDRVDKGCQNWLAINKVMLI